MAVGARLVKATYTNDMHLWAQDPASLLPKPVLLQRNVAALQHVGPCFVERRHEQQQVDELEKSLRALPDDANIGPRTRIEHQLATAKKRLESASAALRPSRPTFALARLTLRAHCARNASSCARWRASASSISDTPAISGKC